MKTLLTLVAVLVAWCCPGAEADRRGAEVVVVYNTAVAESKSVADHYAKSRNVPAEQVLGMKMPDRETISRQEYREFIEQPLRKEIEQRKWIEFASEIQRASAAAPGTIVKRPVHATIRYLVLCYGVPLKIAPDSSITERLPEGTKPEFRRNEAAVDNELCLLPRDPKLQQLSGILPNPFAGVSNSTWLNPTNGLLLVARVDGPSPAVARGLVDKALFAEQHGLWGRGYFDARGALDTNYAIGDVWTQGAAAIAKQVGFETILDTNSATFPASFPMSHIALYMGWYDTSVSGPFTLPRVEFMPGAFAYHLYSYSAPTLRGTQHWVTTLLDKGATCTFGYVDEPYLQGTVNLAAFLGLWIRGLTFGEAAYGAMSVLSWQTTVIGDPLYRPFGKDAAELHKELLSHKSPLVEWSVLRAINQNILAGDPKAKFIIMLERDPVTRSSAVLQEIGRAHV